MLKTSLILLFAALSLGVLAQKKTIDHTTYDKWRDIKNEQISDNGSRIVYEVKPLRGDGTLYITDGRSSLTSIDRGKSAKVSADGNTVAFKISQPYDTIRKLKIEKVKKDKMPKDSAGIWFSRSDSLILFDKVKKVSLSEKGSDWVVIEFDDKDRFKPKPKKEKKCFLRKKKPEPPKREEKGNPVLFVNAANGTRQKLEKANEYLISKYANKIAYIKNFTLADSLDTTSVYIYNTADGSTDRVYHNAGTSKHLFFDEQETTLGFMSTSDTGEVRIFDLLLCSGNEVEQPIKQEWLPEGWSINDENNAFFSENGKKLFFFTSPSKKEEPEDSIPDDEKAVLDVWNYQDGRLQPQQLKTMKRDKVKGYLTAWVRGEDQLVQLEDKELGIDARIQMKGNGRYCLGSSQQPYERLMSWDTWYYDYYSIDTESGKRVKLAEKVQYRTSFSPDGKWFIYFSQKDTSWHAVNSATGADRSITKTINARFDDEDDDHPMAPDPYGVAGWTATEDVLIYDKFNVWRINMKDEFPPQNLTRTRSSEWSYRYWRSDPEEHFIDLADTTYWMGFNYQTKAISIGMLADHTIRNIYREDAQFKGLMKARDSKEVLFRTQSFINYPDLKLTTTAFDNVRELTEINPQQSEYNWGTVEPISWQSFDGLELDGLLYKPEDFDSSNSYPLMVYFYETYSDRIHRHYTPRPTASIIYPSEYTSNGYVVFIPDIKYIDGHPAKSAYDCIVSGTDYLTNNYRWIDSTRMALQGQSWGGYQTAMLVTMTNKYKCAMAGAPVSNMTSAYGGIRWGSGLSRMFQYEKSQSRLGGTLWDSLDVYIENSPIFFAPKVQTPLLIMHNDQDGAVPWYQGIEYFVSLRRLNKPVWMLNYNGDSHNLRKQANMRDLSRRMRQFFDHYLKDGPEPKWMKEGIPAIQKGKDYGWD